MKVSVVIPVYNREFELKRAISSVLNQTIQDFEILVVDDFSDMHLKPILDEFQDNRMRFYRLDKKGNANVCRNLGIKEAKGNYIAMLDSDDEWLPTHLEQKIKFIEEFNVDGTFGSFYVDDSIVRRAIISRPLRDKELMINYLLSDGNASTPTHVYKADCAKQVLWDESLLRHQDFDFSVRFSEKYRFAASFDLTCVVHWVKGARRNEHFESMMKFINKYKENIDPPIYCEYHRKKYTSIMNRPEVSKTIKQHYRRESIKYIEVLSLTDYLSTFGLNKSGFYKFYLRLEFLLKVLFK